MSPKSDDKGGKKKKKDKGEESSKKSKGDKDGEKKGKKEKKKKDDDALGSTTKIKKGKKKKGGDDEPKPEGKGKKKKGGDEPLLAEDEGGKKKGKKKKKKIPKFEDIMADVEASGSGADVEAQPELTMEAKEQGDMEMDTTAPIKEEGAGFSAPRPITTRANRPMSSRPAAPRHKARASIDADVDETSGPAASQGGPQVLFDEEEDDEDDNFVVEDKKAAPGGSMTAMMEGDENLADQAEEGKHGLLVTQILETKKSMEEELKGKTEIEKGAGADKGSKGRDAVKKEVARLQLSIQKMTKSANPLGKIMDFLQEDMDSMQRELEKWKTETKQLTQKIQAEVAATNSFLAPLQAAMSEYEQTIEDQQDRISAVRASVLENETKIFRMMAGVMNVAASAP